MFFESQNIITLDEVGSTSNYAANLIRMSEVSDRTVISALSQTSGRGQRGSVWQSEAGKNLLLSIILRPVSFAMENQFYLNKMISLAVRRFTCEITDCKTYIKWPNDIVVQDKKIAGILLECSWSEKKLQHAIVGIGFNLNQETFDLPLAISAYNIKGETTSMDKAMHDLLGWIDHYYLVLLAGHWSTLDAEYHQHLYRLNTKSNFIIREQPTTGQIRGVSTDGRLLLQLPSDELQRLDLKEVRMVY